MGSQSSTAKRTIGRSSSRALCTTLYMRGVSTRWSEASTPDASRVGLSVLSEESTGQLSRGHTAAPVPDAPCHVIVAVQNHVPVTRCFRTTANNATLRPVQDGGGLTVQPA